ncbi:MAG: 23S rRNA pseudouridine(2604) synthase RluF [Flavobacteriaceae bacterium]|nr:MAG: 23S rRNA pseudouridine(2604) synthase RluF [Flavobacteriaceae bacterium]
MKKTRLNKFLSEKGYCSRRAADKLIENGEVFVNGKKAEIGQGVEETDLIEIKGETLQSQNSEGFIYLAFHKPKGIVCTTDQKREKNNIVDYIGYPKRIFPIGRLDKDSEGLILLTNDGDIVNKILRAKNQHQKEYIVTVDKPIDDSFIQKMGSGVPILGQITQKCEVEKIADKQFRIVLTQGLNRQIRRMSEFLGYRVVKLKRIRIMHIQLDLPVGKHRELSPKEQKKLEELLQHSQKTY